MIRARRLKDETASSAARDDQFSSLSVRGDVVPNLCSWPRAAARVVSRAAEARPLARGRGCVASAAGRQLSMQPPLLHSSALRLRPSVSGARRTGAAGPDKRGGGGEISDAMMRRLMSCLMPGSAERRSCKEWDGQNECERHRRSEGSVHRNLLSLKRDAQKLSPSDASPSSTTGVQIAAVLLRRPRRPSFYSRDLGKNCCPIRSRLL